MAKKSNQSSELEDRGAVRETSSSRMNLQRPHRDVRIFESSAAVPVRVSHIVHPSALRLFVAQHWHSKHREMQRVNETFSGRFARNLRIARTGVPPSEQLECHSIAMACARLLDKHHPKCSQLLTSHFRLFSAAI